MNVKNKSPFKKNGMFNEANPFVFELAKGLRKNMTAAEMILWGYLKAGITGLKFRRQHPLGIYVADFYCHQIKLIIEVDGSIHNKQKIKEYDLERQDNLMSDGYTVIRFSNQQILNDIQFVLSTITSQTQNLINSSKNLKA